MCRTSESISMRNANIFTHIDASVEELSKLNTRHLLAMLKTTRSRHVCSCGPGWDCGDEVLSDWEREDNQKRFELGIRLKQVLKDRPHVARDSKERTARNFGGREKKVMRY